MKTVRITPICKSGDKELVVSYRQIFVLPCFSEILDSIMYNRLYLYLTENSLLNNRQLGF